MTIKTSTQTLIPYHKTFTQTPILISKDIHPDTYPHHKTSIQTPILISQDIHTDSYPISQDIHPDTYPHITASLYMHIYWFYIVRVISENELFLSLMIKKNYHSTNHERKHDLKIIRTKCAKKNTTYIPIISHLIYHVQQVMTTNICKHDFKTDFLFKSR